MADHSSNESPATVGQKIRKIEGLGPQLDYRTQEDIFNLMMLHYYDAQKEARTMEAIAGDLTEASFGEFDEPPPALPPYASKDGKDRPSIDLYKLAATYPEILDHIYRIVCSFESRMNQPAS